MSTSTENQFFLPFALLTRKKKISETRDDEASRAKVGQKVLLNSEKNLFKNHLNLIVEYLECNEMSALIMSNKRFYLLLRNDRTFQKLLTAAYLRFYMKQFMPTIPEIPVYIQKLCKPQEEEKVPAERCLWKADEPSDFYQKASKELNELYNSLVKSKHAFEAIHG